MDKSLQWVETRFLNDVNDRVAQYHKPEKDLTIKLDDGRNLLVKEGDFLLSYHGNYYVYDLASAKKTFMIESTSLDNNSSANKLKM